MGPREGSQRYDWLYLTLQKNKISNLVKVNPISRKVFILACPKYYIELSFYL